jgi:hypothetical protein
MTRGAGLAVREKSEEEELTSGPKVAVRESEEGGGSGPARGWWVGRRETGGVRLGHAGRKGEGEEGWVFFKLLFLLFSNLFKPKILKLNFFLTFQDF